MRRELGLSENVILVGLIARFDAMKDHETFFKAAGLLIRRLPGVHFMLAGAGVSIENAPLARMVCKNGLNGAVHLVGPRDDVPRLTAALDLGTSASIGEGFCNAIGEAMACAVPCVATDVGDAARIVADTGRVVPPRNPEALAAACHSGSARKAFHDFSRASRSGYDRRKVSWWIGWPSLSRRSQYPRLVMLWRAKSRRVCSRNRL